MTRIILEGMDRDNTGINFIVREFNIPQEATRLRTSWGNYALELKFISPLGVRPTDLPELEVALDVSPIGAFESIQTAIVEHPQEIRVYSWAQESRFDYTLKCINALGGFRKAHHKILENPHQFYHGFAEVRQGPNGPYIDLR